MVKTIGRQVEYDLSCSMQKNRSSRYEPSHHVRALGRTLRGGWVDEWSVLPFFFPLALQEERQSLRFIHLAPPPQGYAPPLLA